MCERSRSAFRLLGGVALLVLLVGRGLLAEEPSRWRVALYDGFGGSQTCIWETREALALDPALEVSCVTAADLARGVLRNCSVLVIPGGSGSRQFLSMGEGNQARVKAFVRQGGGVLGICAGAYMLSSTPGYSCLGLMPFRGVDIEHDNRGHGVVRYRLEGFGKELFAEQEAVESGMVYYEGPVLEPVDPGQAGGSVAAQMLTDVHEEGGAPEGMTVNRPFIVLHREGKGRVAAVIAHPETTPGKRWMVPRMVRWAAAAPQVPYARDVVRPEALTEVCLFTPARLREEAAWRDVLARGTAPEKIAAMDWLERHQSWDGKRWVQGLLYDGDASVRNRVVQYMLQRELTMYGRDLRAALAIEEDQSVRKSMEDVLNVWARWSHGRGR